MCDDLENLWVYHVGMPRFIIVKEPFVEFYSFQNNEGCAAVWGVSEIMLYNGEGLCPHSSCEKIYCFYVIITSILQNLHTNFCTPGVQSHFSHL